MDSRMTSASPGGFEHVSSPSSSSSSSSSRSTSPNPPQLDPALPPPSLPPALPALILRKMVALQLVQTGFEAADEEAIEFLEGSLYTFFESLVRFSHDLAELGRRHEPTLQDVVEGARQMGVVSSPRDLSQEIELQQEREQSNPLSSNLDLSIRYARSTRRHQAKSPTLLPSDDELPAFSDPEPDPQFESPPPSPKTLHTDDDDDEDDDFEEVVPLGADGQPIPGGSSEVQAAKEAKKKEKLKRKAEKEQRMKERERRRKAREFRNREFGKTFEADWAPKLPPKHSWKQTPVFPEQPPPPPIPDPVSRTAQSPSALALSHLSTLRSRLNDSQLVASSLRNLIRRTGAAARGNPHLTNSTTTISTSNTGESNVAPPPLPTAEEAQVAAEVAAEQEADLVSYENEWYGSSRTIQKSAANFKRGKRNVRVIKVDDRRDGEDGFEKSDEEEGGNGNGFNATVGGVAKRRRWLV
ncbi:hypothetical protein JCM3765_006578 [Sporobolomyces pararoseus]